MRSSAIIAAGAMLAICISPRAEGYCLRKYSGTKKYASWQQFPVEYRVSDNLKDTKILAAIDAAFKTWGSVTCSKLSFKKAGTFSISSTKFQHSNKAIYVFWYKSSTGFPTSASYAAYTFSGHDNIGGIVVGSIAVNAFSSKFGWATDGDKTKLDVQAQMTTLIGQVIGLDTSNASGSVMNTTFKPGDTSKRTLSKDDKDGLHYLYNESNCPAAPKPGTSGCSSVSNPLPDGGSTKPGSDGGSTKPGSDGGSTKPGSDGGSTTSGDGGSSSGGGDGGSSSSGDGGGATIGSACTSHDQCGPGQLCSSEGKCIAGGGDDGGCCAVASDEPPKGPMLIGFLLLCGYLATRRRHCEDVGARGRRNRRR